VTLRLLAYARTSGSGDGEDSLDAQVERCSACALRLGHEIVGACRDEHVEGTLPAQDRPGLLTIIMAIEDGAADGFVVHRIDRLARSLHVQEAVFARVWAVGGHVKVYEASGREILRDDPDDPYLTFVRQLLGGAAQLERGLDVARLRGGRSRAAARGEYIGGLRLHPRYGYDLVDGVYVKNPGEQRVIVHMAELRERMSLRAVAAALDAEGVPAPASDAWHYSTIGKVLAREGLAA
jgi:DNA invertase Pin-like site-specific DNA recombinase